MINRSDAGTDSTSGVRRRSRRPRSKMWLFALPAMLCYGVILVVPSAQGVYASFTDWSTVSLDRHFIGFDNYRAILSDSSSFQAVMTTIVIAAATSVLLIAFGLLLALALNSRMMGRNFFRAVIFAPVVISPLVCGYLFQYILGPPGVGALNQVLESVGLQSWERAWLGEPKSALISVIGVIVWQFVGANMVIFLAALQNVPPELKEAAALDGAGSTRIFWHIVRPIIAPAFTVNLTLNLIGGLKVFDQVYATTSGGPGGATDTISTVLFRQFTLIGALGYAAALATILTIGVGIFAAIQFKFFGKQDTA